MEQERETLVLGRQHRMPLITLGERILLMLNTVNCSLVKSHSGGPPSGRPATGERVNKFLLIVSFLSSPTESCVRSAAFISSGTFRPTVQSSLLFKVQYISPNPILLGLL